MTRVIDKERGDSGSVTRLKMHANVCGCMLVFYPCSEKRNKDAE